MTGEYQRPRYKLPGMSSAADAIRTKFGRDLAFNLVAFAIMGVAGIAMNVVIGRAYDAAALGVFNQLFAVHIVLSQFAVLGVHFSVLRYVPEHADDARVSGAIVGSALVAASLPAIAVTLVAWALMDPAGRLFDSEGVRLGMPWIVATVWVFAINKVLMNALNGAREMRSFAVAQGGRFVVMLALLGWLVSVRAPADQLVSVIFGAEVMLLLYVGYCCARRFPLNLVSWRVWLRRHLAFGAKGFLSGSMSELNSRVDVIVLGIFATDGVVGVYSFAATVAEGLSQLPIVLRNNLNPLLTQAFTRGDLVSLREMTARARRGTYLAMAGILAVAAIVFPFFVDLAVGGGFGTASVLFAILCAGLWVGCGYLPLDMYLVQCGYPGWQSGFKAAVLLTNIAFNLALIPPLGAYGAAIAMAATWALAALYVRRLGYKATGVAI